MFGWEFPPYHSGGLGTACYGLTKGLSKRGVDITFVVPTLPSGAKSDFMNLISAGDIKRLRFKTIDSPLQGYVTPEQYSKAILLRNISKEQKEVYGKNLFSEVYRYAQKASLIAATEDFDIIHCHDWLTYQAGLNAKEISGKPLVVHVHATEFDRTGGLGVNQTVYNLERRGMEAADRVIAVSNFTKNKIVQHYGIDPIKIDVVHNAVSFEGRQDHHDLEINKNKKIVLFLGRITLQKGPDYFLYTARRVLDAEPDALFVIAGTGDMSSQIVEKAAELGIGDKVLFTGFLTGEEINKAYRMADVYVMPSVSEPFGITPLEAMRNKTPVIISKQSGVSEVVKSCLKADFWDIERMANQIVGLLRYSEAKDDLSESGHMEVQNIRWDDSAGKCLAVYNNMGVW